MFKNVAVIPPGTGMAHQVNLEYLSRVVSEGKDVLFPDSVVGTDSHITMVNGLGILGWGVGGIETEAVMLGLPVSLTLPEVVGCELTGSSNAFVTSIDVVLGITKVRWSCVAACHRGQGSASLLSSPRSHPGSNSKHIILTWYW